MADREWPPFAFPDVRPPPTSRRFARNRVDRLHDRTVARAREPPSRSPAYCNNFLAGPTGLATGSSSRLRASVWPKGQAAARPLWWWWVEGAQRDQPRVLAGACRIAATPARQSGPGWAAGLGGCGWPRRGASGVGGRPSGGLGGGGGRGGGAAIHPSTPASRAVGARLPPFFASAGGVCFHCRDTPIWDSAREDRCRVHGNGTAAYSSAVRPAFPPLQRAPPPLHGAKCSRRPSAVHQGILSTLSTPRAGRCGRCRPHR